MTLNRRLGLESSETRAQLIEAAAQLIGEEGCAAVTARRLAEKFGLKRQTVHYYFGTIDDLLVAVIRRDGERVRERLIEAASSDEPLRALWEMGVHATPVTFDLTALATRRPAIRAEVSRYAAEFRQLTAQALERHLALRGLEPSVPPVGAAILLTALSQTLAVEQALDVSVGHAEIAALVEAWLENFAKRGDILAAQALQRS